MNYYDYETGKDWLELVVDKKNYMLSMFTEEQLEMSCHWRGTEIDKAQPEYLIRSNWNWELMYRINQAKGIRE